MTCGFCPVAFWPVACDGAGRCVCRFAVTDLFFIFIYFYVPIPNDESRGSLRSKRQVFVFVFVFLGPG